MGDRLGNPGVVGFLFLIFFFWKRKQNNFFTGSLSILEIRSRCCKNKFLSCAHPISVNPAGMLQESHLESLIEATPVQLVEVSQENPAKRRRAVRRACRRAPSVVIFGRDSRDSRRMWQDERCVRRATGRQRSNQAEYTGSRPITEVKQLRAGPVLGWVTAWETPVSLASFF